MDKLALKEPLKLPSKHNPREVIGECLIKRFKQVAARFKERGSILEAARSMPYRIKKCIAAKGGEFRESRK